MESIKNEVPYDPLHTLRDIVDDYLGSNDFNGLYGDECYCCLGEEFMLCPDGDIEWLCRAGYKQPCDCQPDKPRCPDSHIGKKKVKE